MTDRPPWALRWCSDRPGVWGSIALASLAGTAGSLWLGYGFAVVVFLLGAVTTAVRAYQVWAGDANGPGESTDGDGDPTPAESEGGDRELA